MHCEELQQTWKACHSSRRYGVLGMRLSVFLFVVIAFLTGGIARADEGRDVLILKNGDVITGTIVELVPDISVTIVRADGQRITIAMEQIDVITRERAGPEWTPIYSPGELTFHAGYGFEDGYNFGIGIRIGTTLEQGVYIGGLFVYHFGRSYDETFAIGSAVYSFSASANALYGCAELGYSGRSSSGVTVRPYALMGYFHAMAENKVLSQGLSDSEGRFFLGPGLLLQIQSGRTIFGIDGRYTYVTGEGGSEASAFAVFGMIGFAL